MINLHSIFSGLRLQFLGIWCALFAATTVVSAQNFVVKKGGECKAVGLVQGENTPKDFYGYMRESQNSSHLREPYSQCNATVLFLYHSTTEVDPGLYLMILHNINETNGTPCQGGSAEFTLSGLPDNSNDAIAIMDDSREPDPNKNYTPDSYTAHGQDTLQVKWTWGETETDGIVLRLSQGALPANLNVKITPQSLPDGWKLLFLQNDQASSYVEFQKVNGSYEPITITTATQLTLSANGAPLPDNKLTFDNKVKCSLPQTKEVILQNSSACPLFVTVSDPDSPAFTLVGGPVENRQVDSANPLTLLIKFQSDSPEMITGNLTISSKLSLSDDLPFSTTTLNLARPARVGEPGYTVTITSPSNGSATCADEIELRGVISPGFKLIKEGSKIEIGGETFAMNANGNLFDAIVKLNATSNQITAVCVAENDASGCRTTRSTTITVNKLASNAVRIVINEILYDPKGIDLGLEKIELKNVFNGADTLLLEGWGLWITHANRQIFWKFPSSVKMATKSLLVVHWLANGPADERNFYTGVPAADTLRGFSVLAPPADLLLGGANNFEPFAIALVKGDVNEVGPIADVNDACRMVDFVQFGGQIQGVESFAVLAGLWRVDNFISFPLVQGDRRRQEGFSYEYDPRNANPLLTESKDFFRQALPSIGRDNFFETTPPNHLLISEISVRPLFAQFVEIFNPFDTTTIALEDYFLTNDGGNGYTRLVKGRQALEIKPGEFFVRFPKGAKIAPGNYQTIALRGDKFSQRYSNAKPTYEILDSDGNPQNNMIEVKNNFIVSRPGGVPISFLRETDDRVMLLKWIELGTVKRDTLQPVEPDSSDLIKDVDYVFWGPHGAGDAVEKTGTCIEGIDRGPDSTCYKADTPASLQQPIMNPPHGILKSWQRPQTPREFNEALASGNGISGHDETSEDLKLAFSEATPSPAGKSGALDLQAIFIFEVQANPRGRPNKFVNIDEKIRLELHLKNLGSERTGLLYTILRTAEPFIKIGADSVAIFPGIAPGDTAVSINTSDFYEFDVASDSSLILPNELRFRLFITEKPILAKGASVSAPAEGEEIEFTLVASNNYIRMISPTAVVKDSTLVINFRVKNDLQANACLFRADNVRVVVNNDANFSAFFKRFEPNPIQFGLPMCRGAMRDPALPFTTFTRQAFDGQQRPLVLIKLLWEEEINNVTTVLFNIDTLDLSQPLPSFRLQGQLRYFNDPMRSIQGATVKLFKVGECGNSTLRATASSNMDGNYVFPAFTQTDAGKYMLTVTHFGAPAMGAIDAADAMATTGLSSMPNIIVPAPPGGGAPTPPPQVNYNVVFQKIAADMNRDGNIDITDRNMINSKAGNLCTLFPLDPKFAVSKDWRFFDPARAVIRAMSFTAPESVTVNLGFYNFNVNFAGIAYGEVNGSAAAPIPRETNCSKSLSGRVTYYSDPNRGVPNVILTLTLTDGTTMTATTDASGAYNFNSVPAASMHGGLFYTLTAAKTSDLASTELHAAINGGDRGLLSGYLSQPPTVMLNPEQLIAANVSCDNAVNSPDFALISQYVLNQPGPFDRLGHWHFIKKSITASANNLAITQDLSAILLGDINGNWAPPSDALSQAELKVDHYPFMRDLNLAPGEVFKLPLQVASEQGIASVGLDLKFDPAQLAMVEIEKNQALQGYHLDYKLEAGSLRATLSGADSAVRVSEVLFVTFRAIGQPGDSSLMVLQNFVVNDAPGMQASARLHIVKKAPEQFFLAQNYPNPFNPTTTIDYGLAKHEYVRLQIFNMMGQLVSTLIDQRQEAGYYQIGWAGIDQNGQYVPSGVYFIRLKAGQFSQVRKLTVMR